MRGLFWNVRGIGQDIKRNFIRDTILEKQLDFVGLQETIKSDFTKNELHNLAGGRNFLREWIAPRGKSGGILVGINNDCFNVIQVEKGVYFVKIHLFDKVAKFSWNLVTVYGDAQKYGKAAFLAELSRFYQDNPQPCVIGGDFNLIKNSSEKNKPGGLDHFSFVFNAIIEHAGLRDLPLNGRKYTWANNLPEPTYEKLDRILIYPD